ncbi:MAG: hypothetical protein JST63_09145 [Bacteroidetes bacterium]|nr:hypothetical protein [Bacteroidota bacterium]
MNLTTASGQSFMFFVEAKAATNATSFIKLTVAAAAGYDCFQSVKLYALSGSSSVLLSLKKFILSLMVVLSPGCGGFLHGCNKKAKALACLHE